MPEYKRRPRWLKLTPINYNVRSEMGSLLSGFKLHTVCEGAQCPNREECFGSGTATFLILGNSCTRKCTFCAVDKGIPLPTDPQEPEHIVTAIKVLKLRYVVVTSVTRDDLPDGGASHFAKTVLAIHRYDSDILVEVLIPDFNGSLAALATVTDSQPAVTSHNIETTPRLYPHIRPKANYHRSIQILRRTKDLNNRILTKSGFMLGLGESREEVMQLMYDLREAGCDMLTIGQYLQPSLMHHKVVRFVPLEEFNSYAELGRRFGFRYVAAGPLVRSSFRASEMYDLAQVNTIHRTNCETY